MTYYDRISRLANGSKEVKYKDAREQVKTGDIVFMKGESPGSRFIRFFTRSKYSHVGIAFWMSDVLTGKRRLMVAESNIGGTRVVSLSSYAHEGIDIYDGLNSSEWLFASSGVLDSMGAIKYSYLDFVTIYIKESFGMNLGDVRGQVCSEFVSKILKQYCKRFKNMAELQSPQNLSVAMKLFGSALKLETSGD